MINPDGESCATCVFSIAMRDVAPAIGGGAPDLAALKNDARLCLRFPPHVQVVMTPQGPGTVPALVPVMPGDWCGEYAEAVEVEGSRPS